MVRCFDFALVGVGLSSSYRDLTVYEVRNQDFVDAGRVFDRVHKLTVTTFTVNIDIYLSGNF